MPQNITSKPVRKSAARPGVKHLSALVEACIEAVRERNAAHPAQTFSLEPVNPVRIVFAFSGGRDSTALLDVLAKIYQDARQTSIARPESERRCLGQSRALLLRQAQPQA